MGYVEVKKRAESMEAVRAGHRAEDVIIEGDYAYYVMRPEDRSDQAGRDLRISVMRGA